MEVLSDILSALHVSGSVYFCDHVDPPWKLNFKESVSASFHMVRKGECRLELDSGSEVLNEGDFIFIGPGIAHSLLSDNREPVTGSTLLLCGYCQFDNEFLTPLKAIFPHTSILRASELSRHPWIANTFSLLTSEFLGQKPGSEVIVNKLTEVILIELIRIGFGHEDQHSLLRALSDERISKALQQMHDAPESEWTIDLLASHAGMSRASFAKQFKLLVGQTVFVYLSLLRMQKAKHQLRNSRSPVGDIGESVGYDSERAFIKTFKKYVGVTPHQYRMSGQR